MDLSFTPDQDALRGLARQIFSERLSRDRLREISQQGDFFDRDLWRSLAKANLLGIAIPTEHGGEGLGFIELCLLLEEAGRAVAPIPLHQTLLAALTISRFGSKEQRERFLPGIARGELALTSALVDHASRVEVIEANGALNGSLHDVASAHISHAMLVPARSGGDIAMFIVDLADLAMVRNETTNGEPRFSILLDETPGERLGDEATFQWMLERALVGLCAMQVGVSERALRITAEYTSTREQFGRPLASFQAVQQRAADCYIDVEAMRWTMWQAAWKLSEEMPGTEEVEIAKFWAADGGFRVAAATQHLHGGVGVDVEYPLHRYSEWARQLELTLGGAASHLEKLGELMAECP
ncbi:MAG: acyl-CoA dehydrogenase family protein [Actinomycetota bacterium]